MGIVHERAFWKLILTFDRERILEMEPASPPHWCLSHEAEILRILGISHPLRRFWRPVSINEQGLNVNLTPAGSYLAEGSSRGRIVFGLGCRHEAHAGTRLGVAFSD
ncbi:hypothetical protein Vi05172_g8807 [Venturia inaequalis]|nr:hypothetical protein Vi05172_g8807 [Venturia inaequalis]